MDGMPRPRPPHLHCEPSRHGKIVWYVRRGKGCRVRLRAAFGTPEFWTEYRAALDGAPAPAETVTHTLAWTIKRYMQSSSWAALRPATRKQRGNIYRVVIETAGNVPLAKLTEKHIHEGRERRKATPHAANNFLKAMRGLLAWAVKEEKLLSADPTKGVSLLKGSNDAIGFHTWTEAEVTRFEERYPLGTRERLAFDLMLYTGLRRGDVVRVGRQHVRDGSIAIRTEKSGFKREVTIPILPPLAASIAEAKTGDMTFLVTERGAAFVKEGFGNWFGEICRRTGCPGSAHGLRKAGATRVAENGATIHQMMAMFDWTTEKMALHYTRTAEKKRMAADAVKLLMGKSGNSKIPHLAKVRAKRGLSH